MMAPLVSVCIPAYKSRFLGEAINSVLFQTVKDLELIIVNDHSPEDIDGVVNQFNDPRIVYYTNEKNLGGQNPVLNWNKCLSYANGKYFSLLCDDDLYEPDFVANMLQLAEEYPQTNVFRARANFIDSEGKEIDRYPSAPSWESWDDYLWHVINNYRSQTISEWMYRSDAIKKLGGYAPLPLAWYADYLSIYRFAQQGGIASTAHISVHFRLSGDNISSQDNRNNLEKIDALNQYRDAIAEMLRNVPRRDNLLKKLDRYLLLHLKYNLKHAPKCTLLKLLAKRKKYRVSVKQVLKALF